MFAAFHFLWKPTQLTVVSKTACESRGRENTDTMLYEKNFLCVSVELSASLMNILVAKQSPGFSSADVENRIKE